MGRFFQGYSQERNVQRTDRVFEDCGSLFQLLHKQKRTQKCTAFRWPWTVRVPRATTVLVCLLFSIVTFTDAYAFELFGYHLWGEKSEDSEDTLAGAPDPTPYRVDFRVVGENDTRPSKVEKELQSVSLLVQNIDDLPSGPSGVLARATQDFERLIGKLYEDGYYGALVQITVQGMPLNQVVLHPEKITERPIPINVEINQGPQFKFGAAEVTYEGPATTNGLDLPTAEKLTLVEGEPALSAKVLDAESKSVDFLKDNGYPFARVSDRQLLANHASQTLKVKLHVVSGAHALFGPVSVTGTENMDPDFVRTYANLPRGEQWDAKVISRAQTRLRDLEVFSSIRFENAANIGPNGELPITIVVAERPKKSLWLWRQLFQQRGCWC